MKLHISIFFVGTLIGWLALSLHLQSGIPTRPISSITSVRPSKTDLSQAEKTQHFNIDESNTQKIMPDADPLKDVDFSAVLNEILNEDKEQRDAVAVMSLLTLWADRAPEKAFRWVATDIGSEGPKSSADAENMQMTLSKYMVHDADAAGRAVISLPTGHLRTQLIMGYAKQLGKTDSPAQAHNWVLSIEDPQARELGLLAVAETYVTDDPHSFLYFIEDFKDAMHPENSDRITHDIFKRAAVKVGKELMYNSDPDNIIASANELFQYPDEIQADIAAGMLSHLMAHMPASVDEMLDYLPHGNFRDESIEQYVIGTEAKDPQHYERLADLTTTMEDGFKKSATAGVLLNKWQDHLKMNMRSINYRDSEDHEIKNRLMELIVHNLY